MIKHTTGTAPSQGLRAGGHYSGGALPQIDPNMLPQSKAVPPVGAPAASPQYLDPSLKAPATGAPSGAQPSAAYEEQVRNWSKPQPKIPVQPTPMSTGPTIDGASGAPKPVEPAAPQSAWQKAKSFVTGGGEAAAEASAAPKGLGARALGVGGKLASGAGRLAMAATPIVGAVQAANDSDENVKNLAGSVGLDYNTDSGRVGANVVNFLDKTGNAATFGLAGAAGRAISNKLNRGSWFADAAAPAPAGQPADAAAPAPSAPANQTADTFKRLGMLNSPQQGAGQGPRGDGGTDLTAALRDVPRDLPANMADGAIYKTVGAHGEPVYSGRNVGLNPTFLNGKGESFTPRGSVVDAAAGAPVAMGPNGSYAVTPSTKGAAAPTAPQAQGAADQPQAPGAQYAAPRGGLGAAAGSPAVSAALQAAAQRGDWDSIREHYQQNGGTFAGQNAQQTQQAQGGGGNGAGDLLLNTIRGGLAKGQTMTRASAEALGNLNHSDKTYRSSMYGHDRAYDSSMYGHDVAREGNQLSYQSNMALRKLELAKMNHQFSKEGAEGFDADNKKSTFATLKDDKGVPQANEAMANELGQFMKSNAGTDENGVPLETLKSMNPHKYNAIRSAAETQYGIGKVFNKYAGTTMFGEPNGWAAPKITDIREGRMSDFPKGVGIGQSLVNSTGVLGGTKYGKVVEVNVNGTKKAVPLNEFLSDQNGGQYKAYLNQWLRQNNRKQLGDDITSGS
jgi:hypothetical protein